jgi:hypothetical protein
MGQAAVDLSDTQKSPAPASIASADDLLSQLAGAEIDRLLAEAEAEQEPAGDRAIPKPPSSPRASPGQPSPEVDAQHPAAVESPLDSGADPPPQDLAAAVDQELTALIADAPPPPLTIGSLTTAVPKSGQALSSEIGESVTNSLTSTDDGPSPFYVRMLEWMNAPMARLPEPVLDTLGKVAILTLFNSIAVLLYVLLFRKQ